jgi:predicted lipoprotein with Yx(FWY)xxD motif
VKRTTYSFALLAVVGAIVIAGCGGGSSSSSSGSGGGEGSTKLTSSGGGTISGAEVPGLGTVLVDSEGMTVYEFTPDEGMTSVCYGGCEAAWPPVVASGKPTAGEGAMSADLGTTKRKDGTEQVTYKGHPLYTFVGDKAPGEANGQEVEGTWFALDEGGSAVKGTASAAAEPEETESSGGGEAHGY